METEEALTKIAWDLTPGDFLVGDNGGQSLVKSLKVSDDFPGYIIVETEHGTLTVDPEREMTVL